MLLGLLAAVAGAAILSQAADKFVDGAASIAHLLKVSPIVIGAVIIGFGTSAPEMLVSGIAAAGGDGDLGIGNIIGSNIANLSLILGAAALLVALRIDSSVLRREAPLATGSVIVFVLVLQGGISFVEGLLLLAFMVVGLYLLLTGGNGNAALMTELEEELHDGDGEHDGPIGPLLVTTIIGLVGTVGGAWVLVWGATEVAAALGFNNGFVGLTLVAVGTSLPELVTAATAARSGHDELIVGNLLGSNIFNSLGVGAVVGLLGDGVLQDESLAGADSYFMLAVCIGVFILMWVREPIDRPEGVALLIAFGAFLVVTYLAELDDSAAAIVSALGDPIRALSGPG
ncbi:MAG: calcium/sodium antiporter [Acidimicrobiales bacterium]